MTPDEIPHTGDLSPEDLALYSDLPVTAVPNRVTVVRTPTVAIIGRQVVVEGGVDVLLHDAGSPDWGSDAPDSAALLVELAGRTCYQSFGKGRPGGNKEYVRHVLEVGHGSVVEHAVWTLLLTGVSRSLTHELVRHRAGMAYSQLSQRYVDESVRAKAVVPAAVAADPEALAIWHASVSASQFAYERLCARLLTLAATRPVEGEEAGAAGVKRPVTTDDRKAARGAARSVLTNSSETKVVVTGNARAWRHFIEMRCHPAADREIRDLALSVYRALHHASPNLFADYSVVPHPDGGSSLTTPYRKV